MSLPAAKPQETAAMPTPAGLLAESLAADRTATDAVILARLDSGVPLIPQLARYLIAAGGKRLRPLLTLACTRLFDAQTTRCHGLAAAVEFIHSATLLHDDVVDASLTRRGNPSANGVFGNKASVLVGDFLFARAFELMVDDGSLETLRVLSKAAAVIAEGEVMQLKTTQNTATTWDEYNAMIGAKTAALFAAACETGAYLGGQNNRAEQLRDYGYHLGMAFQIADDVLDYTGTQGTLGKDPGDDFREGKMTAPVLHALGNATAAERTFWEKTLANLEQGDDDFTRAVDIMNGHGAFDASLDRARTHAQAARNALAGLPEGPLLAILADLPEYALTRLS